jgi:hypothetical protein
MKLRQGFVSNSSSSSFIVLFKIRDFKSDILCDQMNFRDIIAKLSDDRCGDSTEIVATGKQEIFDKIEEWFGYERDKEIYDPIKEAINKKDKYEEALLFDLSYHDLLGQRLMDHCEKAGDIKVLYRSES